MKNKRSKQQIRLSGFLLFISGIILAIIIPWMAHCQTYDLKGWAVLLLVPMFVCFGSGTILIVSPQKDGGGSIELHNH